MSSGTARKRLHSAAWRVSLWATLWWAVATLIVFLVLHQSVAKQRQEHTDIWVAGEARTMSSVALETPRDARYDRVLREVAETASREMPGLEFQTGSEHGADDDDEPPPQRGQNGAVFFLETRADGQPVLWAGPGDGSSYLAAIRGQAVLSGAPFSIWLSRTDAPYRVSAVSLPDGGHMFLGMSERGEYRELHQLLMQFLGLWAWNVLLGFAILFLVTRRVLERVQRITLVASRIGESDLSANKHLREEPHLVSLFHAGKVARLDELFFSIIA